MILTKKKMKEIAGIYEKEICAKVPDHEDDNYEFSSEYDDEMRHMILGAEIKPIKKTARAGKRAVGAAVAAAVICIMLGFNTEVRATVASWFRHHREDDPKTVVYEFNEDYTDKKLPQITIGWLPEDFEGVEPEDTSDDYRLSLLYVSEKGRVIDIFVEHMDDNNRLYIIPEENHQKIETITIKGLYSELYQDLESTTLIMFEEKNGIVIVVNATVTEAELVRIAENIEY